MRAAWSSFARTGVLRLIAIAALLIAGSPAAQAGPPYLTDDPEPVDWHQWEIFIANLYQRLAGASSGSVPLVEVNYGIAPEVEVHSQIALDADDAGFSAGGHHGLSDLELGVEWRFLTETDCRPQISFYPTLELPTGQASFSTGHTQLFLPLWAQKSAGRWTVYGGGGYWINPGHGNRNYTFTGVATEVVLVGSWTAGGELYHSTSAGASTPAQSGYNLGSTVAVNDHVEVLASAGHSLSGAELFTSYAGVRITF